MLIAISASAAWRRLRSAFPGRWPFLRPRDHGLHEWRGLAVTLGMFMLCLGTGAQAQSPRPGVLEPARAPQVNAIAHHEVVHAYRPSLGVLDSRLIPARVSAALSIADLAEGDDRTFDGALTSRSMGAPAHRPFVVAPAIRRKHVFIGMAIGALAGVSYVIVDDARCIDNPNNGPGCGFIFVPALIVVGAGGAAIGGVIGALVSRFSVGA